MSPGRLRGADRAAGRARHLRERFRRAPDPNVVRLAWLVAAVEAHRSASRSGAVPVRPADHDLYRRLDGIAGGDG